MVLHNSERKTGRRQALFSKSVLEWGLSLSSIVSWDSEDILHVFTKGQVKGVIVCFLPVDLFKNLCLAAHPSDMRVPQTRPKGKKTLTPSQTIEGDVPSLCISTPSFSPVFVT